MTIEQHRASLHQPAFSELLPVRDILNDVIIRTTGALVAGYELSGINSYYHNDDGRNRTKRPARADSTDDWRTRQKRRDPLAIHLDALDPFPVDGAARGRQRRQRRIHDGLGIG